MPNYTYSLTVRKTALPVYITAYDNWIIQFKSKNPKADVEYHYESKNGLHFHAIIRSPRKIYINRIHPGKGWNVDLSICRDEQAWTDYIRKDADKETTLINSQYKMLNDLKEYWNVNNWGPQTPSP